MKRDERQGLGSVPEPGTNGHADGWDPLDELLDEERYAAAAAEPAEPEPIIIESGGSLRLSQFFALRLWPAALIPLVFAAAMSSLAAVRVGPTVRLWGGAYFEDLFFTAPGIPIVGWNLLPFGIPMSVDTGYGYAETHILQTSLPLGLLALIIGLMLVAAVTRRSDDAIYAAGPYLVYSLLGAYLVARSNAQFFAEPGAAVWALTLGALLAPLVAGMLARLLSLKLLSAGLIEIESGPGLFVRQRVYDPDELEPEVAEGEEVPQLAAGWKHVTFAQCCPYCGNTKLQHENPRLCGSCHRNIGILLEIEGHPACASCEGILVKDAVFCHHCGTWQQGDAELPDSLEVA